MGIVRLTKGLHMLRDLPFIHMLRRHLRDPNLITYYNHCTGQWVLAYWLDKTRGLVDEIDDLGPNLEELTPEFVRSLERSRGPTDFKKFKKRMVDKRRNQARDLEITCEKSRDERTYLRRKGWEAPYVDIGVPSGPQSYGGVLQGEV